MLNNLQCSHSFKHNVLISLQFFRSQTSCGCQAGIPGTPGKPGDQGQAGRDGRDGMNGINGVPGQPGRDGASGRDGLQGPVGSKGKRGPQGPVGPPGPVSSTANWKECVWKKGDGTDTGKIKVRLFGYVTSCEHLGFKVL